MAVSATSFRFRCPHTAEVDGAARAGAGGVPGSAAVVGNWDWDWNWDWNSWNWDCDWDWNWHWGWRGGCPVVDACHGLCVDSRDATRETATERPRWSASASKPPRGSAVRVTGTKHKHKLCWIGCKTIGKESTIQRTDCSQFWKLRSEGYKSARCALVNIVRNQVVPENARQTAAAAGSWRRLRGQPHTMQKKT